MQTKYTVAVHHGAVLRSFSPGATPVHSFVLLLLQGADICSFTSGAGVRSSLSLGTPLSFSFLSRLLSVRHYSRVLLCTILS